MIFRYVRLDEQRRRNGGEDGEALPWLPACRPACCQPQPANLPATLLLPVLNYSEFNPTASSFRTLSFHNPGTR